MSTPSPKPLGVNVFTAPEKPLAGEQPYPFGAPLNWDPITSTLLYGAKDAVLKADPNMPVGLRATGLIYDVATGEVDTVIAPSPKA